MRKTITTIAVVLLTACAQKPAVRVTDEKAAIQAKSRSEPIFYNGKTYRFDMTPSGGGGFALKVSGMTAAQSKDAVALATSSLRYYACPDGQNGILLDQPSYAGGKWHMSARCG